MAIKSVMIVVKPPQHFFLINNTFGFHFFLSCILKGKIKIFQLDFFTLALYIGICLHRIHPPIMVSVLRYFSPAPRSPGCSCGYHGPESCQPYFKCRRTSVSTAASNFVARRMAMCLSIASASMPKSPFIDTTKWESRQRLCRHYFR